MKPLRSMIESLSNIVTIITPFLPLAGAAGMGLSLAGLVPRVGPGRALWIALRSRYRPNNYQFPSDMKNSPTSKVLSTKKIIITKVIWL